MAKLRGSITFSNHCRKAVFAHETLQNGTPDRSNRSASVCYNGIPARARAINRVSIKVDKIISAVVPLEQGADWFAKLYAGAPGVMKVILAPQN